MRPLRVQIILYTIGEIGHNKRKKDTSVAEEEPQQAEPEAEAQAPDDQPVGPAAPESASLPVEDEAQVEQSGAEDQSYEEASEAGEPEEPAFSWQASEYVHNHKGFGWYFILVAIIVVLIGAAAFLRVWPVLGMFAVMGVAIGVYAHKPPRTLTYQLTSQGIVIEGHVYPFKEFRSFGVIPETEWHTIDLEPTRRLRPRMAVLFDPKDLEAIVDHMEQHLPRIDRQPDVVERVTQYLRF